MRYNYYGGDYYSKLSKAGKRASKPKGGKFRVPRVQPKSVSTSRLNPVNVRNDLPDFTKRYKLGPTSYLNSGEWNEMPRVGQFDRTYRKDGTSYKRNKNLATAWHLTGGVLEDLVAHAGHRANVGYKKYFKKS